MPDHNNETLILGAGVSGLTVAHHLPPGADYLVLEKKDVAGGLATQFHSNGYWFDYGGHYFHFQDKPHVQTYLEKFCRFNEFQRKSKTFLLGKYIPFPVQFHLSRLPGALKAKILDEMLATSPGTAGIEEEPGPSNMHDFLLTHFGPTLTGLFFKPFLTKYYNTDVSGLASNMDKGSIPVPDKTKVLEGYSGKTFGTAGYNPVILYPATSLRQFIANYSRPLTDGIRFNEEVVEIDTGKKRVKTGSGTYGYNRLVTTIPLKRLLQVITDGGGFPDPDKFKHTSTLLVNVVLKQKRKRFHWVYLAEEKFPFYRAGFYASHRHPVCYLERNVSPGIGEPIDREALSRQIVYTLKELQVIEDSAEIRYFDARIIPVSYVIFDRRWHSLVPPVLEQLKTHDIYSIGRWGAWNYSSMANDIKDAMAFAECFNLDPG
ncbi:MAG: NAD(P)-binding protein [bacterium]|nr:NAD(P)-binding protein [bacterium]